MKAELMAHFRFTIPAYSTINPEESKGVSQSASQPRLDTRLES